MLNVAGVVKDFECGGIRAAEFCRRRGMSTVSLAQWRHRYSVTGLSNTHRRERARAVFLRMVAA
jgi:hypothetical protein